MTLHAPNDSMGVVVTLKSKMAASSASSGIMVKVRDLEHDSKLKQIAREHIRTHVSITAI